MNDTSAIILLDDTFHKRNLEIKIYTCFSEKQLKNEINIYEKTNLIKISFFNQYFT